MRQLPYRLDLFNSKFDASFFLIAVAGYLIAVAFPQFKVFGYILIPAAMFQGIKDGRLALFYFITVVFWPTPLLGLPFFKLVAAITVIKIGLDIVTNGARSRLSDRITHIYAFWMIYAFAMSIFAPPDIDIFKYLERALRGFIAFFAIIQLLKSEKDYVALLGWMVIAGGLGFIINIAHYKAGLSAEWIMLSFDNPYKELGRILPWGAEPNYYASMMIVVIGISYGLLGYCKEKSMWIMFAIAAVGCHGAIFGTYSKSGMLAICLSAAIFIMVKPSRIIYMAPLGILIILGILSQDGLVDRYSRIYENIIDKGGTGRFTLWGWAFNDLISNPANIIYGNGLGWFQSKHGHAAHNTFLTMLVDGGLVSLGAFIWLLYAGFKKLSSCSRYYRRAKAINLMRAQGLRSSLFGTCAMYMTVTDLGGFSLSIVIGLILVEYSFIKERTIEAKV